jgi:hypothetical protein
VNHSDLMGASMDPRLVAELDDLLDLRERGRIDPAEHRRRVDRLLVHERRTARRRVGITTAVGWGVTGLAFACVSAQLGAPKLSGWLALFAGPVVLLVVGSRHRLRRRRDWIASAGITLFLVWLIGGLAMCVFAMALY